MANLLRFAPFRGELEVQSPTMKCPWRETAQIAKPSEGQRVSDCRCLHVDSPILSDSVPNQRESGEEAAEGPRSKTSKHTPRPKPLCFKISVPRTRPLHLRTLTSHRCCKVQIVFVQSKIVTSQSRKSPTPAATGQRNTSAALSNPISTRPRHHSFIPIPVLLVTKPNFGSSIGSGF